MYPVDEKNLTSTGQVQIFVVIQTAVKPLALAMGFTAGLSNLRKQLKADNC